MAARRLISEGTEAFLRGDNPAALAAFDAALSADDAGVGPRLWQRGISLYYADRFDDGSAQFRRDVAENPNDAEEALWAWLCEARRGAAGAGPAAASRRLPRTGRDPRPVVRAALAAVGGGAPGAPDAAPDDARPAPDAASAAARVLRAARPGDEGDRFYALLYAGLLSEAHGDEEGARRYIGEAADSPYGRASPDYMTAVARVHRATRGW